MTVTFLRVTDAKTKIQRILSTIHQHFLSGDKVIIFTASPQAAAYIDQLLWKTPEDSFVPHILTSETTDDRVVITESDKNLNQASVAINLTPRIRQDLPSFDKVYELWDESDPKKLNESQAKKQAYNI